MLFSFALILLLDMAAGRLCASVKLPPLMGMLLVGAAVDIQYAAHSGVTAVLLVLSVLLFRMLGVAACVTRTALSRKERLFCMLAYTPKATVQAAIGAIPLSMGLAAGNTILTVAVVAILVTAPLGAFLIDLSYRRCLSAD